ncbi:uncharacterized protein LOC129605884 [Condylostylus longicornis]|uniref:uncharacterized protein LOC129605884 n=1 Tax=Condylostylus longicornis TaxID=2530218 RepID=UPI00244E3AE6|nr:uncharacterized protein LOC129605884 [Condylostylus longicornis]
MCVPIATMGTKALLGFKAIGESSHSTLPLDGPPKTKGRDIARFIKSQRLKWLIDLNRMDESKALKRIFEARPLFQRNIGRPKLRWKDGVEEDLRKINITSWWQLTTDREGWRRIANHTKAHTGL